MNKTTGLFIGATLLILILVPGLACGAKSAQAPTSPPPITENTTTPPPYSQTPEEISTSVTPTQPGPDIPANFTTYIDDAQIFSISYPADWKADIAATADIERKAKETVQAKGEFTVEKTTTIFLGGLPVTETLYLPSMNVSVGPPLQGVTTVDQWAERAMQSNKKSMPNFKEYSRVKTTVDGREAVIVDWAGSYPGNLPMRVVQMFTLVGEQPWQVACATLSGDLFTPWQNDFNIIVRSFRILD